MKESILRNIEDLERSKENILNILRAQKPDDLARSEIGKWSMIQVARHVQISENTSLSYMKKKVLAGDKMPNRGFRARLLLQVLFLVFWMRLKFKAPKVIANPHITTLEELEQDWEKTRREIKQFVEDYPDNWLDKAPYRHPAVGRLSLADAIRFFKSHLKHHTNQLHRVKKSLGSE